MVATGVDITNICSSRIGCLIRPKEIAPIKIWKFGVGECSWSVLRRRGHEAEDNQLISTTCHFDRVR